MGSKVRARDESRGTTRVASRGGSRGIGIMSVLDHALMIRGAFGVTIRAQPGLGLGFG